MTTRAICAKHHIYYNPLDGDCPECHNSKMHDDAIRRIERNRYEAAVRDVLARNRKDIVSIAFINTADEEVDRCYAIAIVADIKAQLEKGGER